jgi:CDP-glucose 4,6-dehydratase
MGLRKGALEDLVMLPNPKFWAGKRVLLTGHTGFKGSWLAFWLDRLGARVTGVALPPDTEPHLFGLAAIGARCDSRICDIRDAPALAAIVREAAPEIVLHLAAQPLVRASYAEPIETFATNVMGTANLLDALRGLDAVRVLIAVTTDKVYRNRESARPYGEEDRLGGHDPYSASKAAAELVVESYGDAFLRAQGLRAATARAGNVIGGGDWSQERLIPDAVRAWGAGETLHVRRPDATRPWQHVLEPLAAYLVLAEALWERDGLPGAFNFGPEPEGAATVRAVIEQARAAYGKSEVDFAEAPEGPHEAGFLALDIERARTVLGISPKWPLDVAIARTMRWYRALRDGGSAADLCLADIQDYEGRA